MTGLKLIGEANDNSEWMRLSDDERREHLDPVKSRTIPGHKVSKVIIPDVSEAHLENTRERLRQLGVIVGDPVDTKRMPPSPVSQTAEWHKQFRD